MGGLWGRDSGVSHLPIHRLTIHALLLAWVVAVAACTGGGLVPVKDHSAGQPRQNHHVVRPGDTLYSVAWEVGVDFQTLAQWNGIDPPYLIKPGARLRTVPPLETRSPPVRPRPRTPPVERKKYRREAPKPVRPDKAVHQVWVWPTRGAVIAGFSPKAGRKGIDIGGKTGQSVYAASGGSVVYAGTGLRGYGRLIIVKHDETFLSAYAHNRKLLVREGRQVEKGEKIAEMGSTGSNRVKLHFQIRRRGTPVDPRRYLPKR